jgi:ankyrin repeat protein
VFFYPPPPTGFASLQNLFTPLHMAAFNDEIEVATLLIDRGAEPTPEVERGR